LVVLPIEPEGNHFRLVQAEEAKQRGFFHLAEWVEKAEEVWQEKRSLKSKRISALDWLDYRRKLTNQASNNKIKIIYNKSGTFLTSCIVETDRNTFLINGQEVIINNFLCDHVTFYLELNDLYQVALKEVILSLSF